MGSSREAFAALRARLDQRRGAWLATTLPGDLYDAAAVIGADPQLRSALSDSGRPVAARTALVDALFGARLPAPAVEVLRDVVGQRWSGPADLLEVVEGLAAQAAFLVAEAEGTLDRVEGEIFDFSRVVSGSAPLQMALTDPSVSPAQKAALVESLVVGRTTPMATQVLTRALGTLRGRRPDAVLAELMDLAAEQRDRSVAEVRVAVPLGEDQARRLAAALSRLHGRTVRLNVAIDPDVIGGVSVRIGGEVIDGTIATRIEQARRALVG